MRSTTVVPIVAALLTACAGRSAGPETAAPTTRPSAAAADPGTIRYTPGSGRYLWESEGRYVQEVMGSTTDMSLTTSMLLSTTIAAEGGNISMALTVDSLNVTGNAPGGAAESLGVVRGQTYHAMFTPTGRPVSMHSPDTANAAIMQIARGLRDFLPLLPETGLVPGAVWVDTVSESHSMPGGGGSLATNAIRTHRLVGWETRDGVRSAHVAISGSYTITGNGEIQGQAIEMAGAGQATGERWISSSGVYLGGSSRDSTNMTVTVINVGITVPIRQVQRTTIARRQ
jgi:hypothetical protein